MKIFTLKANENWICDRFAKEWEEGNPHISTANLLEADVIWLLSSWQWRYIPMDILTSKKVVATIHHIVPEKFDSNKYNDFKQLEKIVDEFHVPSIKTYEQVRELTSTKISTIPFWVNQNLWYEIERDIMRKKYNFDRDEYLIGSFQRDTEGHDLRSPKLEKGPDLLCDYIIDQYSKNNRIKVVLAGWRRQYVINRLQENNIPYVYHEMCDFKTLNELYNTLDLYLVTARHEGGPQAIVECALNKTPIISTDVGIASTILSDNSIFCDTNRPEPNVAHAYNRVLKYTIPSGFFEFEKMFRSILNEGE